MFAIGFGLLLFLSFVTGTVITLLFVKVISFSTVGLSLMSGGFLAGLLCYMLIPHAIHEYDMNGLIIGFAGSLLCMFALHPYLHRPHNSNQSLKTIFLSIAFHTIPLSLTTGTIIEDTISAQSFILATILHHIPEGVALSLLTFAQKERIPKLLGNFLYLSLVSSIFVQIGLFIGDSMKISSLLMGISVGLMTFIVFVELIISKVGTVPMKKYVTYIAVGWLSFIVLKLLFDLL